ncbi:Helicase ATP-binding domain-containing protein, partial [Trichostrongylus colubriformis]
MTLASQVLYDPSAPLPNADDSNQLVVLPGKKRKVKDDGPLPKKKSATGGKKGKNYIKEKEKQKVTKKMKRQLAAVQQRKANKQTQEELFASLAEYQLDSKKLNQLASSSHMQDKLKSVHSSSGDDVDSFPTRMKVCSSKVKLPPSIHQKQRVQENYYPTDDEDSDGSENEEGEITVTVICGETGSGKTTQIPQFLYEAGYASNSQLIGITEPRRVAAITMAQRVGEELGSPEIVSYQIRYEGNRTSKTKILFMTDGVLMKEMESDVMLKKYSAILIDEAHERSMYSDVLIGMLSRIAPLRAKTSNPLKLIIMSATLRLADFVHKRLFPVLEPKVINVESRQFPVTVCRIHEALPDGAILVFVSGQQEVRHLVKKLIDRYTIQYDSGKDGHVYVRGSKTWKRKQLEVAQNLKLEDFSEDRTHSFDGEDLHETGACDTLWDDYDAEEESQEDALDIPMPPPPASCTPLYCLPLYSLLSSEKQRRVFDPPPEGTRMCVIATNVAETSLTIPEVKYVVDCGFEKRRLYSSAVFQTFEKFSRPEILDKPADQLVLHLKSMNIVKVINFPFPSSPNSDTLEAAEERLIKLGALVKSTKDGKTEARITPLGKTLSIFPLAPAYAKVIAMANQHDLMPYAILLISALSVREPLVPVSSVRGQTDEETKEKMTALLKLRRGWCGKGPGRRLGDLLVLMRAVICYESEKMNPVACANFGLRHKAMVEIRRLRTQLTNIVNTSFNSKADAVMDPHLPPPSDAQAQMLRQMMVAGLADRIARRVDRSADNKEVPKGAYQTMKLQEFVFIDPCSVLYTDEPDYVIYQEIVQLGDRKCMQGVMMVDHEWLPRLA